MASNIPPPNSRNHRACIICSIILPQTHFINSGCPNCESFLNLAGSPENVQVCTSQVYSGGISLADPSASWVARWQRLDGYVPGVYAVKVEGQLPDDVLQTMEDSGVRYMPRDGSAINEDL
ncbi:putative transcriptional elongation protein Spt4 [Eremomyces bilateralis CBS 781.70]|uniref:Transcription elongation factor SPT4 n=1 Tax=Eremomyces bilateralis CBS 781.70 TaxID=1392243 RepID=A0A6G1FZG5_9PEZI|nr:putative transcriptional elongation protein Spt4 [Eremomyces bilateralis CBS 781.70]KAF1811066.1 putative transcriptional elongation protein Spt4 [Eremomyces bilateralis CBS 781.70]